MGKNDDKLKRFQSGAEAPRKDQKSEQGGISKLIESLKKNLPADVAGKLSQVIEAEISIPPKVAVIGKSGVGKTTTINSLFNTEWHTSESITGTTEAQMETFQLKGEGKLSVVDMPGMGDSIANDLKFMEIYKEILPDVDVVLYIIQADDRGLGEDERIIRDVVMHCDKDIKKKLVIAVNKVDLLGENEGLEWNPLSNLPTKDQKVFIERKCEDIAKHLIKNTGVKKDAIVYYSAVKRYRLYDVLYAIVMHSGTKGWKFAINPKDWTELADPEIMHQYEEFAKTKNK